MADTKLMTGFDVSPTNVTGKVGDTVKLTISNIQPADVTNGNIVPSVADASVATVTPEPNSLVLDVKLLKAGATQINLKSGDGNFTKAVPVTVTETGATQPTAPVQPDKPTEPSNAEGYVYYFSDPDDVNPIMHHLAIPLAFKLPSLPWHWHTEKPSEDLKDAIWDIKANGWVENSKDGQATILQEATQKLQELDKKSEELDQANTKIDDAVKAMQQVQAQSSQQSAAMMKSFTEQSQSTNKMLATMQQTLAMVVKSVQGNATQDAPKTDTKQENGGK